MMAHTPGPWYVDDRIDCSIIRREDDKCKYGENDKRLATVHNVTGVSLPSREYLAERRSNAQLIASAPDMADEITRLRDVNAMLVAACKAARDRMSRMERGSDGCVLNHLDYMYILESLLHALDKAAIAAAEDKEAVTDEQIPD